MVLPPGVAGELELLLQKLGKADDVAVVVEGKKDRAALEAFGISGSRVFVLSRKPLFAVAETVAERYNAVVILTDLDSEGRKLYGKLSTLLQGLGVKIDGELRVFLFRKTKLRQIEGLSF
ncbi:topoisomerase [Candidatus Woesearchaeota archaeon]|nr:topoisomerase [Candidatus Woesearchaeota archaeon]